MRSECLPCGEYLDRGNRKRRNPSVNGWEEGKVTSFNSCNYPHLADIHHYVTPVRANRIIVELGGHLDWREASRILTGIADLLPFGARFVSQELLDTEAKLEFYIAEKNVNPFYPPGQALLKNYAGCRSFISPWHLEWGDTTFK